MKVNAVDSYRVSNINFEGKKGKKASPKYSTAPLKSVPVVVLMAMSPLNAPMVDAKPLASASPQTEVVANREKVVAREKYNNATPDKKVDCTLNYLSIDGDDNSIEKVQLVFSRSDTVYNNRKEMSAITNTIQIVNMNTLRKKHIFHIRTNGSSEHKYIYYVEGPGSDNIISFKPDGTTIGRKMNKISNQKIKITEQFYNDLKSISDESINIIEEDVIHNDADNILPDIF